ncbi:MAG: MBL fold metallo-hydrolase [Anaerolineae bacterium]
MTMTLETLSPGVYRYRDTCNVYVLKHADTAVLVDFGSGEILDHLPDIGVTQPAAILMTHHHRDQGQGLRRAVDEGIPIWVPHTEQDLFHSVDIHWQARAIANNYNVRQDRFSLLDSVPVAGTLRDYQKVTCAGFDFTVVPTPGHTVGAIALLVDVDGQRMALTGDLIAAPGKIWSLSATQWTYNGAEGAPATIASLLDLEDRRPDVLLPSHGEPILDPPAAIKSVVERLWTLLRMRGENPRLFQLRERPYQPVTPHLLMHRASMANTYVLLSESGRALFLDFGYDFVTGIPAGTDRASRRPWLYTLPALKAQFGVRQIDVVLPTHYHDDHVAGMNLLREVEGTQVWAAETFADILETPASYDLPCLWYDPIPVDRRLPLEQPISWEEYALTLYPLPGHTRYAVAITLEVDGNRVLATGDQFQGDDGLSFNYVFQNRYQIGDYAATARLYRRLAPDLILPGHWQPLRVTPGYLDTLVERADQLEDLERALLPEAPNLGTEGFLARIHPYQATTRGGEPVPFDVELLNPFAAPAALTLSVVVPEGWTVEGGKQTLEIAESATASFRVLPPAGISVRRARLAVDVTVNDQRFGQQAEALVTVVSPQDVS